MKNTDNLEAAACVEGKVISFGIFKEYCMEKHHIEYCIAFGNCGGKCNKNNCPVFKRLKDAN